MWFKHNRALLVKVSLLLVVLLVVGLASSGCVRGLQPVGWSGGTISEGTLFVGSKEGRLVAVSLADESCQWSEPLTSSSGGGFGLSCAASSAGVAIYGAPAISEDLVYVGGYNGKVHAFNSSSLELRWVYPREGSLQSIVGGVVVAQGRVYFGDSDGKVYALDAATGDKQWEFETGDKIWSTPAVSDGALFVGSFDNKLYALDAVTGEGQWEFEAGGAVTSTPLVYNEVVYVGSFDRYLYALDAASGNLIWKFMGENCFWAEPVVYDDIIYAANLDGEVYALQADSGAKVAEFDLESPVSSSPVVVNRSIIFASQQGVIYTLDTIGNELGSLADIGEKVYGPLCASEDGVIYIHTQDLTLHRINANTGAVLMSVSLKSQK